MNKPMPFIGCRTALSLSLASRAPAVRRPRWSQLTLLQTRGKHNQSRQPSRTSTPTQYTPNPNHDDFEYQDHGEAPYVKVRFLIPAIWALTVSSGIYVSLAYLEAKSELEAVTRKLVGGNWVSVRRPSSPTYNGPPTPTEVVTRAWRETGPMSQLSWELIGLNGVIHLSRLVMPVVWSKLWHVPASNRNSTLLTSIFVHTSAMHLAANSYALYGFLPATGYSPLFDGDTCHMLSFYLSAGIISSLGQHIASTVFTQGRPFLPFTPSGGASGALFGVFAAFCAQYPHRQVGIILLPFHIDAQYLLPMVMLFDFVGMIRGYSFISWGHAAHLSGAVTGLAYAYFDGHNKVWRPLVNFWKRRL